MTILEQLATTGSGCVAEMIEARRQETPLPAVVGWKTNRAGTTGLRSRSRSRRRPSTSGTARLIPATSVPNGCRWRSKSTDERRSPSLQSTTS